MRFFSKNCRCPGMCEAPWEDLEERKASIMAMLSHELKSPLHGITGLSSSLMEDSEVPGARCIHWGWNIVEEVITLCHNSSGEVRSHALSPGVKLQNLVTQPLPVIVADAYRVTQVIYNLVTNAMKFTHEGSITVCGSYDETKQQVMIDVKDTGASAGEDVSESRRYGGLGLGLAISREASDW
eukprot:Skav207722  [mRNA]  locus=scaffold362:13363:20808:- [translate_table: standard]